MGARMKTRVMLDIETLGNRPGSVLLSIGAVKFGGGELGAEFYERIDAASCVALGMRLDAATVLWWFGQSAAALVEAAMPGAPLGDVLERFAAWLGDPEAEIWGKGSDFDNVLVASAYHAARQPLPWKFWNNRCYRTIAAMSPLVKPERIGLAHHALDDAKTQAAHLMKITGL